MATIAFIGLGNMGLPMAQNLLKAGHTVHGFDVTKAAADNLVAAGGTAADTLAGACSDAEVVITMLPAGEHVREVYLGAGGVLGSVKDGTLLIELLDHRRRKCARGCGGGRKARPCDGRCAGFGRCHRRTGGHAHLHGRRPGCGFRARAAGA